MAAKSKKRLSKVENKLLKLDNLQLDDVICPICQSILIQPVTLPCFHGFCLSCFNGSVENNALCCPLCRLRIGSWLRTSTKQRSVVNIGLWNYIQTNFSHEVDLKSKGEDLVLPEENRRPRLSAPGEIRSEYETELKRLRNERLQLEQKHFEETEFLIKKIQEEEEEAHKKYLEALKRDEIVALQMQKESLKLAAPPHNTPCGTLRNSRLKETRIDSYLSKHKVPTTKKPPYNADSKSKAPITRQVNGVSSPEMVPSYGKLIKSIIEKKNKLIPDIWNKENGDKLKAKIDDSTKATEENTTETEDKVKTKNGIPSLLVSLPLPYSGILQQKANVTDNRKETGSVDSMREELCFFKPILVSRPASMGKDLPLRVPGIRATPVSASPSYEPPPSRMQYVESLCHLRNLSIARNLPSAFVIALNVLKVNQDKPKCETRTRPIKGKKVTSSSPSVESTPVKRKQSRNKQDIQADGITKLKNNKNNLRRTRSMGSLSKDENETTPKKAKIKRKAASDRKPYLRSDSKKSANKEENLAVDSTNNNKVNLAVKNLSSPLKNCEVKHILHEQLRIEKIIEQEKSDLEFARQLEEELNVPRTRRAAIKRQVTLNHALRPSKKLKV